MRAWWFIGMLLATTVRAQLVLEALDLDKLEGALPEIVGRNRAFSALTSIRMEGGGDAGQSVELRLMMRAGKIRAEVEIEKVNLRSLNPQEIATFKQMGLGQVTEIARPTEGFSYVILPSAKAYCQMRPADVGQQAHPKLRVTQKKATGQEDVDKHPCTVNEVTLAAEGDDKEKLQLTTWEAKDLKDFPVKIVVHSDGGQDATIQFKDVDLNAPDEWLFEPPVGWRRYPGFEQMLEDRMRNMGGMFRH